jgi:hypothetical protein
MVKTTTRAAAAVAVLASAVVPASASAHLYVPNLAPRHAEVALRPAPSAAASDGFSWGDAAVGAGGMLILVGAGGTAVAAGRRRRVGGTRAA